MPGYADRERLARVTEEIRARYDERPGRGKPSPGRAMFQSRLNHYEDALRAAGLLPLGERRILDVGCGNGNWLAICCQRWGAQPQGMLGTDLRSEGFEPWRRENPDTPIELLSCAAHEIDLPNESLDIVHQSMMLSSVPDAALRRAIADNLWRMLKPGGHLLSYDFWINPVNRRTVGIRSGKLRALFPAGRRLFKRTITLAPPLCRALNFSSGLVLFLERLRILNTHMLVVLQKPARSRASPVTTHVLP